MNFAQQSDRLSDMNSRMSLLDNLFTKGDGDFSKFVKKLQKRGEMEKSIFRQVAVYILPLTLALKKL
jgi:hypothetical protein